MLRNIKQCFTRLALFFTKCRSEKYVTDMVLIHCKKYLSNSKEITGYNSMICELKNHFGKMSDEALSEKKYEIENMINYYETDITSDLFKTAVGVSSVVGFVLAVTPGLFGMKEKVVIVGLVCFLWFLNIYKEVEKAIVKEEIYFKKIVLEIIEEVIKYK